MADPTYVIPGAAIHSFLMFAPFFALYEKKGMILQGVFLFIFGPYTAGLISPNLMEQASIWCFFSIAQIAIMLFCIRETLIINWVSGLSQLFLIPIRDVTEITNLCWPRREKRKDVWERKLKLPRRKCKSSIHHLITWFHVSSTVTTR